MLEKFKRKKSRMPRKSRYVPINTSKYCGKINSIIARSSLERAAFRFLDTNSNVVRWSSEQVVIPYVCATDGKPHRYFIDLYVELTDGSKLLVEIKPSGQTVAPMPIPNMTPKQAERFRAEQMTWLKNASKWKAAETYAAQRKAKFVIWTEKHLTMMGIRGKS